MKPAKFTYHAPTTVEQATDVLARFVEEDAQILAGGQSLVPMMAFRLARPGHLVDINNIAALANLDFDGGHLNIGACVRHARLERGVPEMGRLGDLLATVARHIGHRPIRTRGTFCGSLANADPASEWCLVATTLEAQLTLASSGGQRTLAATEFLEGAMFTAIAEDELLTGARLPALPGDTRFGFNETARRAGDFALAMALVTCRLVDGRLSDVRVGVGGAEERPRRIAAVEKCLAGAAPDGATFAVAAETAARAIDPMEDIRVPIDLRRDLVAAVVRRALEDCVA